MKIIKIWVIAVFITLFSAWSYAAEQHALLTEILGAYVRDGAVNYKELKKDSRLAQYINYLSNTDPDKLASSPEKLAFWINAYNAYTLKIICDRYPVKSINDLHTGGLVVGSVIKATVWDRKIAVINKRKLSLNFIEHRILRRQFKDPRVHFAIVNGAKGGPPLRNEAYEADKLDEQLDEQGKIFFAQENKNTFDFKNKTAKISPIMGWFKDDFGKSQGAVLGFILKFLPPDSAKLIQDEVKTWKIEYSSYDWSLNDER